MAWQSQSTQKLESVMRGLKDLPSIKGVQHRIEVSWEEKREWIDHEIGTTNVLVPKVTITVGAS